MKKIFTHAISLLGIALFSHQAAFGQCQVHAGNDRTICSGQSTTLASTVTGGTPTTYKWYTLSGTLLSNTANFSVSPTVTTTYIDSATGGGCASADTVVITVNPVPATPAFTFTGNSGCAGNNMTFNVTNPVGGITYTWDFTNGPNVNGTSVQHTFHPHGGSNQTYAVTLIATDANGCTASVTQNASVRQGPDASIADYVSITPFTSCGAGNFVLTLDNTSSTIATNTHYHIDWGDGTTAYDSADLALSGTTHTYIQQGFMTLTLTVTGANGCTETNTYTVFNGANPAVGLGNPGGTVSLCVPYSLTFPITGTSANPPGTTYTITTNDGSPPVNYTHPPPATYTHNFAITSCGATGANTPNSFYVRIRASNPCGFSESTIEPITTSIKPVASFVATPNPACQNSTVTITNTSIPSIAVNNFGVCDTTTPKNWLISPATGWTLVSGAMGSPSPSLNPATWASKVIGVSFSVIGTYTITLIERSACGNDTISHTVCIQSPPVPSFTINPTIACAPFVLAPNNTSLDTNVCGAVTYLWTVTRTSFTCTPDSASNFVFINGTSASSFSPQIQFNNQGIYTIRLSATNACGTFTTLAQTVTVKTKPQPTVSVPSPICVNQSVSPTQSTLPCAGTISGYSWSFPGGSPSSSNLPVPGAITYSAAGNPVITLVATNECGNATATASTTVLSPPPADAGPDKLTCHNVAVGIGSTPVGGLTYSWSPTTGLSSSTVANPTVTRPNTGSVPVVYTYIVTVSNAACSNTDTVLVTVNPRVLVSAGSPQTTCQGSTITLAGSVTGGVTTGVWTAPSGTFGDSSVLNTTYTPSISSGTVTLTLTSTDPSGPCPPVSSTVVITVNPLPVANAGADRTLCSPASTVLGSSAISGTTYSWSPGTGLSSTTSSQPTLSLSNNGTVPVTYTYVVRATRQGCQAWDTVLVTINPRATVSASVNQTICAGSSVTLNGFVGGGATSGTWSAPSGSFADPTVLNTIYTPSIASGTVNLTLTTNDPAGPCAAVSDVMVVTVNPFPVVANSPDVSTCSGTGVLMGPASVGGVTYSWSPSTGLSNANIARPTVNITNPSDSIQYFTYILTITQGGCSSKDTVVAAIYPRPVITPGPPQSVCRGGTVTLAGSFATPATSATWSSASGTFGNNTSMTSTFTPTIASGNAVVTLTSDDPAGPCPAVSANVTITVLALPVVSAGPDVQLCNQVIPVSLTGTPAGGTWTGPFVDSAGTFTPGSTGTFTEVYTYTNSNNCTNTDTAIVTVVAPSPPNAGPDDTVCLNQPAVTFTGTPTGGTWGGTPYVTSAGVFTPSQIGTYNVIYTVGSGTCVISDTLQMLVNPLPTTAVNPANPSACNGDTIVLTASGAATFAWSPGTGLSNTSGAVVSAFPASNTTYTVTGTSGANGCANTATVTVTVLPRPVITNNPLTATVCSGVSTATFIPTANLANTTFSWTTTGTTNVSGYTASGTGNIPAEVLTVSDTAQGFVTYQITPTLNGCPGTPADYVVTVNPVPVLTLPAPQSVCANDTFITVNIVSNIPGTTITWTATGTGGVSGFNTSGTGDITSQVVTNSTATPQTITYNITATINGCPSTASYVITVNPRPVVTFSIPDQVICTGVTSAAVTLSTTTPGATINWTAVIPSGITGAQASGTNTIPAQTLVNTTFQPLTVVYTAIASTAGVICDGPPAVYQITVNPGPDVTVTPPVDTICSQTQTNFALTSQVAGTTFSWTISSNPFIIGAAAGSGNAIHQNLQNTDVNTQQVTYTITTSAATCPGATTTAVVTVNPSPVVVFTPGTQSICNNTATQTVLLSSTTNGSTFAWTATATAGITGYATSGTDSVPVQTLSNSGTTPGTVAVAAIATYDGCQGPVTNYTFTVFPTPHVTNTVLTELICSGDITTDFIPTSDVIGTTFDWVANASANISGYIPSGSGNIPPQTLTLADSVAGAITFQITPTANGCQGPAVNYVVNINPVPLITLPPVQTICNSDTSEAVIIGTNVAGTSVVWNAAAATGVSGYMVSGTGNIPAQIIANTNTTPQNVVYTISATAIACVAKANYVITVNPKPVVAFSAPDQTICSGTASAPVSITSTTPNSSITWTSNVPTGITGALTSGTNNIPSQQLINNTVQPLTVIYTAVAVTGGLACPGTPAQYQITVNPSPDITIAPPFDTLCSASTTNFTFSSTATGVVYNWVVSANPFITGASAGTGNGIQQTLQNSSAAPQTVTYTVTATLGGCPGTTADASVTVTSPPSIAFTPGNQNVCSNQLTQQVQLSSSVGGATFNWSASADAWVSGYTASGTDIIPSQLLVNNTAQAGTVTIIANVSANGCTGPDNTYLITVNPTPHILNTDTLQTICSGSPTNAVVLQSDITGATFNWTAAAGPYLSGYSSSGNGNIPVQTIVNSDSLQGAVTYTVNVSANGCPGPPVDFRTLVNPIPVISVNPVAQVLCTGGNASPIIITSNVSGTGYQWSAFAVNVGGYIPNGTTAVIPAQILTNTSSVADTGRLTYTITPVIGACPGNTVTAGIIVNAKPVVDFTPSQNSGCSPLTAMFTSNTSVFGHPDLMIYNWGDGTPNTTIYPASTPPTWSDVPHTFINATNQPVTYTVTLTAVNSCGDTSVTHTVTVLPNTVHADFTPTVTSGCEPLTVGFADNSTGGTFVSWCFNYDTALDSCYGPGSVVAPGTTVQNTFAAGTYTVVLFVEDGCFKDTAFQTIQVTPAPTVDFTFTDNVCAGSQVSFTGHATAATGSFLNAYNWQFGTGDSSVQNNPVYTFNALGVYNACLSVTASNGCSAEQCYPVTIVARPVVDFVWLDTCLNKQPIQFTNTSTGVSFYQWDFGDANTDVVTNPAHSYAAEGTYFVRLVGSTNTCYDTIVHPVVVHPLPVAAFTAPAVIPCGAPSAIPFTNNSTGASGYYWDFGNNTFSTDVNPTAQFIDAIQYQVTLIASNQFHCYDTAILPVLVPAYPVVQSIDISPAEGCRPLPVTFTANTINGNIFTWDFGDGSGRVTHTNDSVTHTYLNAGTYSITLEVFSVSACGDTLMLSDTVKVHVLPTADFTYTINTDAEPLDGSVEFNNRSQNATTYVWDFGDGLFGYEENPVHMYAQADSFTTTLVAISEFGCTDTTQKSFVIFKRSLFVPNAFAPDFTSGSDLVRVWKPVGMGIQDYHAQIFNTWGELLWESTALTADFQPAEGWDGTYQGKLCQQDVYVWKVEAVFVDGKRWKGMSYKQGQKPKTIGDVTLIR